jgi:hypothetical protein
LSLSEWEWVLVDKGVTNGFIKDFADPLSLDVDGFSHIYLKTLL